MSNVHKFQQYQLDFLVSQLRFAELSMDMVSPLSQALNNTCHNTAKLYINFLRQFADQHEKSVARDHSVVFYACCKQVIQVGIFDLEQLLNPDGVGDDRACEMFQQTLTDEFLPQFELSNETFTNEYARSRETLERNMQAALKIDEIQSLTNKCHDLEVDEYH